MQIWYIICIYLPINWSSIPKFDHLSLFRLINAFNIFLKFINPLIEFFLNIKRNRIVNLLRNGKILWLLLQSLLGLCMSFYTYLLALVDVLFKFSDHLLVVPRHDG